MCAQYIGHAPTRGCAISHMAFWGWVLKKVSSKKKKCSIDNDKLCQKGGGEKGELHFLAPDFPPFLAPREKKNISPPLLHWAAPKCNAFFLPSALRGSLFFVHWLRHEASLIRIEKVSTFSPGKTAFQGFVTFVKLCFFKPK